MTDKKLVGISLTKHYDDGSTEAWQKVSAPAVGAILAAGLATSPVGNRGAGGKYVYENSDTCTEHGTPWSVKEGGHNAERGTKWEAFWKCDGKIDDEWCNHRPSKAWAETHPTHMVGPDGHYQAPSGTPANDASEFDDLPWS